MKLVCVGTVAFDSIETPFGKSDKVVGGAATYIGLAASLFTDGCGIVSVIGDDFPNDYLELMHKRQIDTRGIEVQLGSKSFFWAGRYHYDMNSRDTLDTQLNVLADFEPKLPGDYTDCDFLMLGNLDPKVQKSVIDQIPVRPKLVALDTMNYWMDSAMEQLKEVLNKIDLLAINDEEARQLANETSLVKAARKIMKMGPKFLVIKKGEHGALLFHQDQMFFAPALPIEEVVDPTGAGDTFAGGFMGYLAASRDLSFENMKRATIFGSALASFTVEKFGTERLLNISREDLEERVQLFVDLVDFDIQFVG